MTTTIVTTITLSQKTDPYTITTSCIDPQHLIHVIRLFWRKRETLLSRRR